ncbi:MAG: phosphoglucosamine mutase [Candidatus Acidoferrales bacterium]
MAKLFGTDGIRGLAGQPPLDSKTIYATGHALGEFLRQQKATGKVLLGEDTRESSPWVTSYLAAGLRAAGAEIVSAGVIPTPALAQLVCARPEAFGAAAMVSASHNPYRDNGIKLIAASGMKFPDETEARLEERIRQLQSEAAPPQPHSPRVDISLANDYIELLRQATPANLYADFSGLHLVVDSAHGAAARVAPKLFRSLGLGVTPIHASPNGRNINHACGALHPESLQKKVAEVRAHLGVALDGDADRAIFVSASGRIVNGDGVLFACARWMKAKGWLKGGCVVGTVMANLGLERALEKEGLLLVRTPVGDRYVLEEMLRRGANLGGEQSGHVIFLDDAPTGDGLLTALKILALLREQETTLDETVAGLKVFPQALRNLRVRERRPLEELPAVEQALREAQDALTLKKRGRVLIRYSGTEPLLRIMVEAETEAEVERWLDHLARAVQTTLEP